MRSQLESLIEEMLAGNILLGEALSEFEKIYIEKALQLNDDHLSKTAGVLGIHRNTLSKRVVEYQNNPRKNSRKRKTAKRKKTTGGNSR